MAKAVASKRKIVGVKKGAGSMATKAKRKKVAPKAADKIMAKAAAEKRPVKVKGYGMKDLDRFQGHYSRKKEGNS